MLKVKHERDVRLRRRRLSLAQGEQRHRDRLAAARPLQRRRDISQHVGVCASFTTAKRRELVEFLAPYRENALDGHPWRAWAEGAMADDGAPHRMPGGRVDGARARICRGSRCGPSSSSRSRTITCREVAFGTRHIFADGATTSAPRDCTFAQLEVVPPQELSEIFPERPRESS